jgi:AmmeMemoRadiSam system protein B
MTQVREPAVAGQFYPGKPAELRHEVEEFLSAGSAKASAKTGTPTSKLHALGIIAPHAGYVYSGAVAGAVYARIEVPRRVIVLCPNHTGLGEALSITSTGSYRTPLGEIPLDDAMGAALKAGFPLLREDALAQQREHAVEVQLPFLQMAQPDLTFVPITVGTGQFEVLAALGLVLAKSIAACAEPVLIVASSDMNHYEGDDETRVKDALAIEQVLQLQPRGLYQTVRSQSISMCGVGPAVAMLTAVLKLGAHKAELIQYATSGDVSGDREHVVGYAGIAVV